MVMKLGNVEVCQMLNNYQIYQHFAPKNSVGNHVSASDFFLLRATDVRPLPWAVIAAQGIFSVFFATLREAQDYCLQRGCVLMNSEVSYDKYS